MVYYRLFLSLASRGLTLMCEKASASRIVIRWISSSMLGENARFAVGSCALMLTLELAACVLFVSRAELKEP